MHSSFDPTILLWCSVLQIKLHVWNYMFRFLWCSSVFHSKRLDIIQLSINEGLIHKIRKWLKGQMKICHMTYISEVILKMQKKLLSRDSKCERIVHSQILLCYKIALFYFILICEIRVRACICCSHLTSIPVQTQVSYLMKRPTLIDS